jgi:hypothetical protein
MDHILTKLKALSPKARAKFYYTIPVAGAQIGLGRTQSYDAAKEGLIPVEKVSEKLQLVPKRPWDQQVKRLLSP